MYIKKWAEQYWISDIHEFLICNVNYEIHLIVINRYISKLLYHSQISDPLGKLQITIIIQCLLTD